PYSTVSLGRVACWQSRVRLEQAPARDDQQAFPTRAALLFEHGRRLINLGQREAALVATREAVAIYRTLATRNPDAFQPDLAGSLNNVSNLLGEVGQREPALAAVREAVDLYRTLATRNPDAFRPAFATSLNSLGNRLSALGRLEP